MNDRQINRIEMAQATRRVLATYSAAWDGTPDTVDDVADLDAHLQGISDAAELQANPTSGVTDVKADLRQRVRTGAVNLAAAVRAYALRRSLTELAGRLSTTATEVDDLRGLDLAKYSTLVVTAAREVADGDDGLVARTSVTQEEIDAQDALDDEFAEALDTPRAAIIAQSRATARIAEHLSALNTLFVDHLDPEVERLATAHPDFARDYRAARTVVNRGRGRGTTADPDA